MSTFPIYRKGKISKVVVKFIGLKEGYVVDSGNTTHIVGSLHTDWCPYTDVCWVPYDYHKASQPLKLPHELELFETCTLASNSTLTLVPNGYVMTSTSGHQVLIPSNSI